MAKTKATTKNDNTVTDAGTWKKNKETGVARPLDVPSGNTCLARAPGVRTFVKLGMVPNSLMGVITEQLKKGEKGEKVDAQDFMKDVAEPEKVVELLEFIDRVVVFCVLEPKVLPIPLEGEDQERDEDALYVDDVDDDDKMFIFQFAMGGTRDLESFRKELASNVAAVSDS